MNIVQYFSSNHDQLFYLIAGLSFVVELTVMGLGGPMLFFAIACFITGLSVSFGLVSGWESELFTIGVLTGLIAVLLWPPLKRFQNSGGGPDTSSDMIGEKVPSSSEITHSSGSIRYSGIDWNSRLSSKSDIDSIPNGAMCIIEGVEGNVMIVLPFKQEDKT